MLISYLTNSLFNLLLVSEYGNRQSELKFVDYYKELYGNMDTNNSYYILYSSLI